jgi:hypothetical protein
LPLSHLAWLVDIHRRSLGVFWLTDFVLFYFLLQIIGQWVFQNDFRCVYTLWLLLLSFFSPLTEIEENGKGCVPFGFSSNEVSMETTCSRRHHTSGSFYLIYFCFPIPMNIYSVCHFLYFPSYLNIYLLITSSQHGGK